jgi:alpha,alpha-trehalose-phosphate synthase [UDP-forming]/trehalose-phosphatase
MLRHAALPISQGTRWRTLARSEQLALLVDLDGTLVDFAPTPELAVLDADAVEILTQLVDLDVRVVVVSGRPRCSIEQLRALVPGAWWVAEHGSWRWDPELSAHPASRATELDALLQKLSALLATPGTRVERKSLSLCIHWRLVAPAERDELVRAIESTCDEWLEEHPRFERLAGVELVEIRQRTVHKGTVVNWVRERMPSCRTITIGDDTTDEDMFAELDDGDASVSVGPRRLQADAFAPDVATARAFLRWLAAARLGQELALPLVLATDAPQRRRHRLLVMSNRTPASTRGRSREVGGLISALEPALRDEHGIWLGWSGQERGHDSRVVVDTSEQPVRARFDLPATVRQQFYAGFCNRVLWPLFHGFPNRVKLEREDWTAYASANERYARHAMELAQRGATIWVHDYHLLLAARMLRALGHQGRIGLFVHIPFPAPDVLATVPWGTEIVDAMCAFDLLGFQTQQFATNFLAAASGAKSRGIRAPAVGVFPATIDPRPFREAADEVQEVAGLRHALGDRRLILGVDRLDYSKGIPERLDAYERLLDRCPEWRRRVSFLQISVPTRAEIPDYAELRERVEGLVGRINGRFGDTDWVPVRYLYRSYDHHVLAQLYRLADVALVTPLRDGMNLVAKEFIAAQDKEHPGVLVLSQYAGAAETLCSAVLTNPFHPEGLAADIDHALRMPLAERVQRHRMLASALEREGDAKAWAQRFLDQLAPRRLHSVD